MIKYCVQMNQLSLAFSFLGRLLKEGQRAKAATINPILKALCFENRIGEAIAIVIDKLPKLGSIPDVISYNILIKGLCSKGNTNLVLQLFFKMAKHGGEYEPSAITYNTVIDELCKVGELAKAFGLYKQMYLARIIPNTVTYTSLIDELSKKGEIEKAKELLHSMISKGPEPNFVTYNTLIDGLCKNSETENAKELLHDMISKGLEPRGATFT
ncbi:pentatricopeptide repeat-containing protein At2g01740-like [Carex rostrata]